MSLFSNNKVNREQNLAIIAAQEKERQEAIEAARECQLDCLKKGLFNNKPSRKK